MEDPSNDERANGKSEMLRNEATVRVQSRKTRRGKRRASKGWKEIFSIYFSNITTMPKKAHEYLHNVKSDMWLAVETHIKAADIQQEAAKCKKWHNTVCAATQSVDSIEGSYGGAWVAARRHLNTTAINGDEKKAGYYLCPELDVAGRNVHFRGSDVAVFAGYAKDGEIESK